MNETLKQVSSCREKAEALRSERKWAEAAAAYEALAKAWIAAAGIATSPSARAERLAEYDKALEMAAECKAKASKSSSAAKSSKARKNSSENNRKDDADDDADDDDDEDDDEEDDEGASDDNSETCEPLEDLLKQLDSLVGLDGVKRQVHLNMELLEFHKKRLEKGLANPELSHHLVFTGNPGTGKTTVARLIAKLYRSMGLLKKGQLVETDREGLVASYIGQTAVKTKEVIKRALGGVLFIDEAYELGKKGQSENDFGPEAIATLLKAMEDHRDNLVVIVAGYPDLMEYLIKHTNPGLPSRFRTTIHFDNYSADELTLIFRRYAEKIAEKPTAECLEAVRKHYEKILGDPPRDFANARDARILYEDTHQNMAHRIASIDNPTVEQLSTMLPEDLPFKEW